MKSLIVVVAALALSSCGAPVRHQKVDGPYVIVAADLPEERSLNYDLGGGASIGRVESTVTAVGHDARYITVERTPRNGPATPEYYYVVRVLDGPAVPPEALKGPFDAGAFEAEAARLNLPDLEPVS